MLPCHTFTVISSSIINQDSYPFVTIVSIITLAFTNMPTNLIIITTITTIFQCLTSLFSFLALLHSKFFWVFIIV